MQSSWSTKGIIIFSAGFIVILFISDYLEREVLVLHVFQSLIYVFVICFSLKKSKWGYAVGISMPLFWNSYNLFLSGFLGAGIRQLKGWTETGHLEKPEHFIALPAWTAHLFLMLCCMAAYSQLNNKSIRDLRILLLGAIASIAYFLLIIAIFWSDFMTRLIQRFWN